MLPALRVMTRSECKELVERRAPEPLVGRGRALVAGLVTAASRTTASMAWSLARGLDESDTGAECLHWLVAGVGEGRRGLEADAGSPIAEGEIGGMVELERGGQVETRTRIDDSSRSSCAGRGQA